MTKFTEINRKLTIARNGSTSRCQGPLEHMNTLQCRYLDRTDVRNCIGGILFLEFRYGGATILKYDIIYQLRHETHSHVSQISL